MKNFYTFLIALSVGLVSFGQGTEIVSAPQPSNTNPISSLADTALEAVDVFAFTITDNDAGDTDVTGIRLTANSGPNTVDWADSIGGIILNDGTNDISIDSFSITGTAPDHILDISLSSGSLIISANSSKTITVSVYLTQNGLINEDDDLSFSITAASDGFTASTGTFANPFTGGAVIGNTFNINVEATQLTFLQQPSSVIAAGIPMPPVIVAYTDENENIDQDVDPSNTIPLVPPFNYNTLTIESSNSSLSPAFSNSTTVPSDYNIGPFGPLDLDGIGRYTQLYFTTPDTGVTLTVSDNSSLNLSSVESDPFTVTAFTPGTTFTYNIANGWLPRNPSGASGASFNDAIIVEDGSITLTGNTAAFQVTVNPNASLTIGSGSNRLRVINKLTLESESDKFSSFIFNGVRSLIGTAVGGTISYKRWVNSNANGNDLIAPPLKGQSWSSFLASETNESDLLSGTFEGSTRYLFGGFRKPENTYGLFPLPSNPNPVLEIGRGYRAGTDSGATLTFSGDIQTNQLTGIAVFHGGNNFPDWNLLGNPFTYYIDAAKFLNYANTTIIDPPTGGVNSDLLQPGTGVYAYDLGVSSGGTVKYKIITAANGLAPTNAIAPGQGFFVAVAAQSATIGTGVVYDPSMIHATQSGDDFIVGRSSDNILTFLKLKLTNASDYLNTEFYFNDSSSLGLDQGYDGRLLESAGDFALYSHLVQDNTGLEIGLQSLNDTDLSNVTIPLGVNANSGEQLTFSINESTLPETVDIYLEDNVTNTFTLLNSSDYIITPSETLSGTGRFFLRLEDTSLSITETSFDQLSIFTNTKERTITIHGQLLDASTAKVFDVQGRQVSSVALSSSNITHNIDTSNYSPGVYIVQIENDGQSKTQKVIIN